jgi:hypothetical protein
MSDRSLPGTTGISLYDDDTQVGVSHLRALYSMLFKVLILTILLVRQHKFGTGWLTSYAGISAPHIESVG